MRPDATSWREDGGRVSERLHVCPSRVTAPTYSVGRSTLPGHVAASRSLSAAGRSCWPTRMHDGAGKCKSDGDEDEGRRDGKEPNGRRERAAADLVESGILHPRGARRAGVDWSGGGRWWLELDDDDEDKQAATGSIVSSLPSPPNHRYHKSTTRTHKQWLFSRPLTRSASPSTRMSLRGPSSSSRCSMVSARRHDAQL